MGSCVIIGFGLKHSLASLNVRKKSALSLSSLFIKIRHGMLNSLANSHACSVWTFTLSTASMTTTAPSAACMHILVSVKKFWSPGVSIKVMVCLSQSYWWNELLILELRFISSGSKSINVLPSSTRPILLPIPAIKSIISARVVFPAPWWATSAMFLISSTISVI